LVGRLNKLKMKKPDLFSELRKKIHDLEPEIKKQITELYDLATKDEKTGVYNYRFFKNIFEIEVEKTKRKKEKLSLIMIDIDFFKKVNDQYGHLVGDKLLVELTKRLRKDLRDYDVLARFGGEEFLILLPGTDIATAKKVAERLRRNLWKNKKLERYKITISLGITEYKVRDNIAKMIKRVDKAMYISKKGGRNKITIL